MEKEKGYAVLQLSMCGKSCRTVMDFQRGVLWYEKFATDPKVVKEEVFAWLCKLLEVAFCVCTMGDDAADFLFNPYGMLMGTDGNLYLLDMDDEKNELIKRKGERKKIREKFECTGEREVQTMFAAGRMIQIMMAKSDIYPSMHWRERRHIKRIADFCVREERMEKKKKVIERNLQCLGKKKKTIPAVMCKILCLALCIGLGGLYVMKHVKGEEQKPKARLEHNVAGKLLDDVYMEQGKKYFLELGDYEESKAYFLRVEGKGRKAHNYIILAEYMCGQAKEEEVRKVLESFAAEDKGDFLCMLRVYEKIGDKEDYEEMLSLGKRCLIQKYEKDSYFNEEREFEVQSLLARIYETIGQKEEADICYEEMGSLKMDEEQLEQYYLQWAQALMQRKDWKEVDGVCEKGIEKVPKSDKLKKFRVQAMSMLPDSSREKMLGVLSAYLAQNPNLIKDEEMKKTAAKYQLKMEGAKVW